MTEPGWEMLEDTLKRYALETDMQLDDIFPSANTHLKAEDLPRDVEVTIESYEVVEFEDGSKPVLHFKGKDRTLVCNKTNGKTIAEMYGTDLDAWAGKTITIGPDRTQFAGKMVPCIRVRYKAPEPATESIEDDDIPF